MSSNQEEKKEEKMDINSDDDEDISDEEPQEVILVVAEKKYLFKYLRSTGAMADKRESNKVQKEILDLIKANNMVAFYESICNELKLPKDDELLETMKKKRDELLKKNEEDRIEAEKNEGDVEVTDLKLKRAEILSLTSSLNETLNYYETIKSLSTGKNIDRHLKILRLCLAWEDSHLYKKYFDVTQKLILKGGDWDRRNKFNVYNGAYSFKIRQFGEASQYFLESIATFSANEIFDYERLVKYTIISSLLKLDRITMKDKLIENPEILQIIEKIPLFNELINNFYKCEYKEFLINLIKLFNEFIRKDFYLYKHSDYYLREIRLRLYKQFLQSYQSVKLQTMANSFGLSSKFLDNELSSFIYTNKLTCKIDKVNGIIIIQRIDKRNEYYNDILKKGDILLARIQRLSRIITY